MSHPSVFTSSVHQSKKSIWIFSDAGGAKQILAAYKLMISPQAYIHHTLLSDRWHTFYQMFQLPVHTVPNTALNVVATLDVLQPDLVVTATSYSSGIELAFIHESRKRNIQVISVIDHNNYPELRFSRSEIEVYPNHVVVFNQENEKAMRALPVAVSTTIEVIPNLYFNYLVNSFKPTMSADEFRSLHQLDTKLPIVVYAPEPITLIKEKFNYPVDERDGLEMILKALYEGQSKFNLIYQCHPNQNREILKPLENSYWTYGKSDITDAIWYADIVISFSSNSIFEARALGKKNTISLLSQRLPGHFKQVKKEDLGYTIESKEELTQLINQILL
jgi:hypothetical protein